MVDRGQQSGPAAVQTKAQQEARDLLENHGERRLRERAALLEEREEKLDEQENRYNRTFWVYNLLRRALMEFIERFPNETIMERFPSDEPGSFGPFRLWHSFTERYPFPDHIRSDGDSARLGLSENPLTTHNYPTDPSRYVEFGIAIDPSTTWSDAETAAGEKLQEYRQKWSNISEKWNQVTWRLDVYDRLLDRLATGKQMPWEADENTGSAAHNHVITIGEALRKYREENGSLPDFNGAKTQFKKWAGRKIDRSPDTAYHAMAEVWCWVKSRQGAPNEEALQETIDAVMEYADRHSS